MKLYGEFSKQDWLHVFGIEEDKVPASFIIHGEWEHTENIILWKHTLENEMWLPKWNTVVGSYEGTSIGFANVYGSPMASTITHQFASIGTESFIQTGYFGGLTQDMKYGDILIVNEALMQDGVSHWYLPNETTVKSDETLVNAAIEYCEKKGYHYIVGTILSTSAMLLETREMIDDWSRSGYAGVDMETATTLAVAKYFNKNAIGLLNLSDHLIAGDTIFSYTEEREQIESQTDEKIREVALYLATLTNKR
ncbi:uridine phosphorylase [Alkalihalophilus lindianensis]|uniref:Uridine phosphorylase n=1 Tax=Alkalihalophilus lindianensis TaxID=1630542 RepID=A0ABU3XDV2_9BACI|nr:uridine phosphorylase [Alkalihalophilus lindianensis]MDV2686063.1 uridine phosphorylase [Alkalihalophilus lindianensis]